ncbi:cysteine synthase [Anopheles sinensis]|uniref:Cysteine synthase n=1 Tax=Anopheles sinensis TaxID=74873 RepID=A0A084VRP8_ANOSI|nr:cysteine synthase [Anopheles sinensis]
MFFSLCGGIMPQQHANLGAKVFSNCTNSAHASSIYGLTGIWLMLSVSTTQTGKEGVEEYASIPSVLDVVDEPEEIKTTSERRARKGKIIMCQRFPYSLSISIIVPVPFRSSDHRLESGEQTPWNAPYRTEGGENGGLKN